MEPLEYYINTDSDDFVKPKVLEKIQEEILEGKVIILKNVFTKEDMVSLRNNIKEWGNTHPVFPNGESPSKYPKRNYHRIDDGSYPSACPHIFHQYGFNSINELPNHLSSSLSKIALRLTLIQNTIANTSFKISEKELRVKVLHYPEGGGFLKEHTHPLKPQIIGLVLSMSKKAEDFDTGATKLKTPSGLVDSLEYHDIGDVLIFRYDLPHEVSMVSPSKAPIDWQLTTGKWSLVLELRDTHNLSHKKSS